MADAEVRLLAVGDIMLGEGPLGLGRGVSTRIRRHGPDYPFARVGDYLRSGDVVFGNLEAPLSHRGAKRGNVRSLSMRGDPAAAAGLRRAGFTVLSLANNHALQHGTGALEDTVRAVSELGIGYAGVSATREDARKPLCVAVKAIKAALLAYCLVPDPTAYRSVDDPAQICQDVARAKAGADLVVVSLHWGNEYIHRPSPDQVQLAHRIIDSGCALILGHHPHVVQGLEAYHGGLIAYSLGNFVFDMWGPDTGESLILRVGLNRAGVTSWETVPVRINRGAQPEILDGREAEQALVRLREWSAAIPSPAGEDLEAQRKAYLEEVAMRRSAQRREVKKRFAGSLLRYPPHYSMQILMDYVARRSHG